MSSTKTDPGDTYIGARVTEDFKHDVNVHAAKQGLTVSDYIKKLIREDMERTD